MKVLLIATLLMSTAFAQDDKGMKLEEIKQKISANIDQKISQFQSHKSCVQAASSKEALKACHDSHKAAMKALHAENKGEREAFKADWKAKKEAKKAAKQADKKK